MAGVVWAPEALGQLASIHSYIRQFDAGAADRLVKRLQGAGDSLDHLPNRGRPRFDGTRELVTVAPHCIRYDVSDAGVRILAIRHTRRQPVDR